MSATNLLADRFEEHRSHLRAVAYRLLGSLTEADAFFAATRTGDFDALVAVLDPDVVLRSDGGEARPKASTLARGAATIAKRALLFRSHGGTLHPVLVNGAAGALVTRNGEPITLFAFTVRDGRIVRLDILGDPARLAAIPLPAT